MRRIAFYLLASALPLTYAHALSREEHIPGCDRDRLWPYDGATTSADVVPAFLFCHPDRSEFELDLRLYEPEDLKAGLSFRDLQTGADVPFEPVWHDDHVRLHPEAPLQQGHTYEVAGFDPPRQRGCGTSPLHGKPRVEHTFTVSDHAVVAMARRDGKRVDLVFSEPVDLHTVVDNLQLELAGEPWPLASLAGHQSPYRQLDCDDCGIGWVTVRWRDTRQEEAPVEPLAIHVGDGIRTRRGVSVEPTTLTEVDEDLHDTIREIWTDGLWGNYWRDGRGRQAWVRPLDTAEVPGDTGWSADDR